MMRGIILMIPVLLLAQECKFLKGVRAEDLEVKEMVAVDDSVEKIIEDIGRLRFFELIYDKYQVNRDKKIKVSGIYADEPDERSIVLTNFQSGKEKLIKTDWGGLPTISPSGRWIAFTRMKFRGRYHRGHKRYDENELWVLDPNTGEEKLLLPEIQCYHYRWSPTSDLIIADGYNHGLTLKTGVMKGGIWLVDPASKKVTMIDSFIDSCAMYGHSAIWSPDGQMFAYTKPTLARRIPPTFDFTPIKSEIIVVNPDNLSKRILTKTKVAELMIKWDEDGRGLLVEAYNPEIDNVRYFHLILKRRER